MTEHEWNAHDIISTNKTRQNGFNLCQHWKSCVFTLKNAIWKLHVKMMKNEEKSISFFSFSFLKFTQLLILYRNSGAFIRLSLSIDFHPKKLFHRLMKIEWMNFRKSCKCENISIDYFLFWWLINYHDTDNNILNANLFCISSKFSLVFILLNV